MSSPNRGRIEVFGAFTFPFILIIGLVVGSLIPPGQFLQRFVIGFERHAPASFLAIVVIGVVGILRDAAPAIHKITGLIFISGDGAIRSMRSPPFRGELIPVDSPQVMSPHRSHGLPVVDRFLSLRGAIPLVLVAVD